MDVYTIKIEGHLDRRWTDWFSDLEIRHEEGCTVLCGPVADQSALHGFLMKIRDLNMIIVSLTRSTRSLSPPDG